MKKDMLRAAAKALGKLTYAPEKPCARGHLLRRTSDGNCIECKRMAEKVYIEQNRTQYNQRKKVERIPHRAKLAAKAAQTRALETPEKQHRRLEKAKLKQVEWRLKNPHHANTKIVKAAWKKENPGKIRAATVKRRVAKVHRTPAWLSEDDHWVIEQAYELAALRTKLFGFPWHVDHIIPLQGKMASGLHVPTNLQVIPGVDNVRKANTYLPA
jgi:hypothetical protein